MGKTGKKIRPVYGDKFQKVDCFCVFVKIFDKIRIYIESVIY